MNRELVMKSRKAHLLGGKLDPVGENIVPSHDLAYEGWIPLPVDQFYTSGSWDSMIFHQASFDVASFMSEGDRILLRQGGVVKYFYVEDPDAVELNAIKVIESDVAVSGDDIEELFFSRALSPKDMDPYLELTLEGHGPLGSEEDAVVSNGLYTYFAIGHIVYMYATLDVSFSDDVSHVWIDTPFEYFIKGQATFGYSTTQYDSTHICLIDFMGDYMHITPHGGGSFGNGTSTTIRFMFPLVLVSLV